MHNITLQSSKELGILSSQIGLTQEQLKDRIIETFIKYEAIGGDQGDCGQKLTDVADYDSSRSAIREIFGGMSYILFLNLSQQIIISTLGDCPMCGCETEEEEQVYDKHSWVDIACTNHNCEYKDSNEPDYDILPSGYHYND